MAVNSGLVMVGFLGIAFVVYMVVKDKIFVDMEGFEHPARAPIQVMTASYSPPKKVVSSGPSAPTQEAPRGEVVVHADPAPGTLSQRTKVPPRPSPR